MEERFDQCGKLPFFFHTEELNMVVLIIFLLTFISGCTSAIKEAANQGDIDYVMARTAWIAGPNSAKKYLEEGADIDRAFNYCRSLAYPNMKECERALELLRPESNRLKAERFEAAQKKAKEEELARTKEVEAQRIKEMRDIIKDAVKEVSLSQNKGGKSSSTQESDIDKPFWGMSERIFGEKDIAVIIGIEGYQNLPKSDYSFDDARLVKDYVKALGFKERNIELLTDEKATKSSIEKTLEVWLRNKAKTNSRVFIYYSGHGSPDPSTGEAYIVPYDGDPNYLSVTGYPLKRLYGKLGNLPASEIVIVIDACFSGAGGRSVLAKGARPLVMMAPITELSRNIAVLSATQGTQISTSSQEKGHGIFTYYFLKALKDGKKNLVEIYEDIKPQVEDEAKQLNVQQSPSISPTPEKLIGRFSLRK